jgi:CMP-N,N'-diacetyllegionaminic acid synthase
MRILSLIPARGGSKRLPGKNIRLLGGKPLIKWTIDAAMGVSEICDILISTDSPHIASICRDSQVLIPWLRPPELSSDNASSVEVAIHALEWYESEKGVVDGVLLLQPTSPFRTKNTIEKGISLFQDSGKRSIVGVSLISGGHPLQAVKLDAEGKISPFFENEMSNNRSQDLPDAYAINGSFYLLSPNDLKINKSFLTTESLALVIDSEGEALDIDTSFDFLIAEMMVKVDDIF